MTLQELTAFAAKFNGTITVTQTGLTVLMPQTKSQAKENIPGDSKVIPLTAQAIPDAEKFIKDWESYWRFKSYIKKKDIERFIRHKIGTKPSWTIKTLLTIYAYQTDMEQRLEQTSVNNAVGFTGFDGHLMSSFAKQYIKRFSNKYPEGDMSKIFDEKLFTKKQFEILKRAMQKYWKQILEVSDERKLLKQIAAELPAIQMRLAL